MINGRQKLIAWFEDDENCFYWTLYKKRDHQNGNYVSTSMNMGEISYDVSKSKLMKVLQLQDNGDYIIVCSPEPKLSSKGRRQTDFTLNSFDAPALYHQPEGVSGVSMAGFVSKEDAEKIADERFARLIEKKEIEDIKKQFADLQKENKELKTQAESGWNKLISGIAPHLGGIIKEWFPQAAAAPAFASAVHGTGDKNITDNKIEDAIMANENLTEEQAAEKTNELVGKFCEALAAKYPDTWLEIIVKLTSTVINQPNKIDMALKFL